MIFKIEIAISKLPVQKLESRDDMLHQEAYFSYDFWNFLLILVFLV